MINDRHTQVVDVFFLASRLAGDAETIESETEVIKSRGIPAKARILRNSGGFQSSIVPKHGLMPGKHRLKPYFT